jgi:hypothetical protein
LTSRIEAMSGIVASRNGSIARPTRATTAVAMTTARTTSRPLQPRRVKAISASTTAMTSLVVGLRRR